MWCNGHAVGHPDNNSNPKGFFDLFFLKYAALDIVWLAGSGLIINAVSQAKTL
jgi:hypothetical protein